MPLFIKPVLVAFFLVDFRSVRLLGGLLVENATDSSVLHLPIQPGIQQWFRGSNYEVSNGKSYRLHLQ